ncbi:MAG: alanine--glyoxylate aminotransferase family protein, partial [Bryobacterales bacterium]|nr:alanine--glyoxylate aminotransferase family protein [Bryobacterales bacterium]
MHIKKQRLLTPGPTPLLPKALHAMMASDMHHRTQDFQKLYRQVLADLKEVFGTSNDVLPLVSSGSGAMEASISNLFRRGDKVIVCTAGKFGERWVAMTRAFGLNSVVLEEPYGDTVSPARVAEALAANPDARGVFIQASETSTGAAHDIRAMGEIIRKTAAIFVIDAITGLGTMPLDIDNWGLDVLIGGSQKAFMIPPGLGFISVSPKAWELSKTCDLPHFYFDLKKELKSAQNGESSWTPAVSLIISLAEALKYVKELGMNKLIENAQLLAKATRAAVTSMGLELFSPASPAASVTAVKAPAGMDSGVIVKGFRNEFGMIIANGQGSMKGQIFRIAHLGYFDF